MTTETTISCIGFSYIQPIVDLYSTLINERVNRKSRIRVSMSENGYSVSIIALCILCVESAINRIKYLENDTERNNLTYFETKFKNQQLSEKLGELYVIRDLIVHNHIWEISYDYDEDYNEENIFPRLLEGYGDSKFREHVDITTMRTKTLKLNINPIKIGKGDVITVLRVLKEVFEFIESQNKNYFPLSYQSFKFEGKYLKFYEIVR